MNNHGQVFVLFIVFIPIILFILFLVVDFGQVYLKKEHLCNITYDAISYKLDGKSNEEIINYIFVNDNNINMVINDNNITTSLDVKSIVRMFDLDIYNVSCSYYINDNNKIERIKS